MGSLKVVEYIWLDGNTITTQIRSKSRVLSLSERPRLCDFPEWSFAGSFTKQAIEEDSDCFLCPVYFVRDPLPDNGDYLVLCEVKNLSEDHNHESNSRAPLRAILDNGGRAEDPWIGFEQEYVLFRGVRPLGWPPQGEPAPQGPYYCSVGTGLSYGRELAIEHARACIAAGLLYYGMNAEVVPGQWEFQIGFRDIEGEHGDALLVADQMWIARWLLHRISESYDLRVSFANKPIKGSWNGSGMHANFSTRRMRDPGTGWEAISEAIEKLRPKHQDHISVYGADLQERLIGMYDTESIDEFSVGESDRGRSIRIPGSVVQKRCGYIEDRRPGANADPYRVAARLIETICKSAESAESWDTTLLKRACG